MYWHLTYINLRSPYRPPCFKLRNACVAREGRCCGKHPSSLIGVIMAAAVEHWCKHRFMVQESGEHSDERSVSYDGVVVLSVRLGQHSPHW